MKGKHCDETIDKYSNAHLINYQSQVENPVVKDVAGWEPYLAFGHHRRNVVRLLLLEAGIKLTCLLKLIVCINPIDTTLFRNDIYFLSLLE